jgi:pimeloyl-ACP methyl ester carboxylesterase
MRYLRSLTALAVAPLVLVGLAACSDDVTFVTAGPQSSIEVPTPTELPVEETAAPETTVKETTTTVPATTTTRPDPTAAAFGWSELAPGVQEGQLEVPLDYADPDGEQIQIYMVRRLATDPELRIGTLLVNPGGPGGGGSFLGEFAEQIYGEDLLARFDIIGFDPRGTGLSEPAIDCVDDLDPYFGIETGPDTPEEEAALAAAAKEFADGCVERSGELLAHISTIDAATDMDSIRQALGEDQISYFGWSYGTDLGSTWATLFPETVRAAVLDGAVNPTTGRVTGLVDQAGGFDSTLKTYLAACAAEPTCVFNNAGDTVSAFSAVLAAVEAGTLTTDEGRPAITQGVFELGVAQALYSETLWPELDAALAAAQAGDGTGLLALYDSYYDRQPDGTYSNDLEGYFAISCADDPAVGGLEAAIAERPRFLEAAPRTGSTQAYELIVCASLPPLPPDNFEVTGAGAGPIMVVGNTGDPATPYEGSKVMAETLEEGFFISVTADSHTAYGLNDCINGLIDAYLVDLTIPPAGANC